MICVQYVPRFVTGGLKVNLGKEKVLCDAQSSGKDLDVPSEMIVMNKMHSLTAYIETRTKQNYN